MEVLKENYWRNRFIKSAPDPQDPDAVASQRVVRVAAVLGRVGDGHDQAAAAFAAVKSA
jgi:hypothetical protein